MRGNRRWWSGWGISLAILGALLMLPACLSSRSRSAWADDYLQLRTHVADVYANLEWMAEHRGLDLYALNRDTQTAIDDAATHFGGAKALRDFVGAFDDPHFRVEVPWYSGLQYWWRGISRHEVSAESSAKEIHSEWGFDDESASFELDYAAYGKWGVLPGESGDLFPIGVLALAGETRVGILRIASFGWTHSEASAASAWERFRSGRSGALSAEDRYDFFYAVCDEILARLKGQLQRLREQKIDALVVDLTGNGGGTDWVDPAARMFTAKPLSGPRVAGVKFPGLDASIDAKQTRVAEDLQHAELSAEDRSLLLKAQARLRAQRERRNESLDRSVMFTVEGATLPSPVNEPVSFATGVFEYLPPGSLPGLTSRTDLFSPLAFTYEEGVYSGPLYLLVDRHTASAAEYFVAVLRDAAAAEVFGEKTVGAGCGYINGGVPVVLEHCGWTVWMPNGARFRRNGINEVEGITPDVPLDFTHRKPLGKLFEAIRRDRADPRGAGGVP